MSQELQDERPIEEPEDNPNIYVVDPDDYQKTKKLEAIYKAKERVRKMRDDNPGRTSKRKWQAYRRKLAVAVADYGNELLPLIEDAVELGQLSEDDLGTERVEIPEFVMYDGQILDHENKEARKPKEGESMMVYRQLERIERKLGLGLELDEDKGPAQI